MNSNLNKDPVNKTFFDTHERSSQEEILEDIDRFERSPLLKKLFDGFPEIAVIINKNRQIVLLNSKALEEFNSESYNEIIGKRFGEAINCIHIHDNLPGCGTTRFCAECGAAKAIKNSKNFFEAIEEECRITTDSKGSTVSFDLLVRTQPIDIFDSQYTMVSIRDISSEKRRDALERIFFHDVLNTAGAVNGLAELLQGAESDEDKTEFAVAIRDTSRQLLNEIFFQRELRNAEDGILQPELRMTSVNEILNGVYDLYKNHGLSIDKKILVERLNDDIYFRSDLTLLIRSLGNLFKNALEESGKNDLIKISASSDSNNIFLNVYNDRVIPENIQLQLFQRSFSTKQSKGRGIGLYSVKLIVEQYLKGKVGFVSDEKLKTIFTLQLPKDPE